MAWFAPEIAPWFSMLSLTAAISALHVFVQRGEQRALVTVCYTGGAAAGLGLLAAGLVALATGQPWFVPFALGVPGVIMSLAFGWSVLRLGPDYAVSEHRKSLAKDI